MTQKTDYYGLIQNRRSIRTYDPDKPVSPDVLRRIVSAGITAPTAKNLQPGRFILITDKKVLGEISACYNRDWFRNAPAVLIVLGNKRDAWVRKQDGFNSLQIDLTIMMDHMVLAAEYEGVSTCWIAAFDEKVLKEKLNLDGDDFICCMTPLGYPPESHEKGKMPERKSFDEMVTWID